MFARALIVLLVILNLGVAAWWLLRPAPPAPVAPVQDASVPRLRLVSEAPLPARGASASPAVAVPEPTSQTVADEMSAAATPVADTAAPEACFTAGPFADAATSAAARTALQTRGASANERVDTATRGGTWSVSMPPQADRAAAQALGGRIAAAGFTDYYVVSGGAQANAIALGRFGNEAAAQRHRAALEAAGFAAQVQPPPNARPRHWLDVRAAAGFDAQAARVALGAPLQPAACGAPR